MLALPMLACTQDADKKITAEADKTKAISNERAEHLAGQFWKQGEVVISETLSEAQALETSIENFLTEPNTESLNQVREQWRSTFDDYQRAFPFLFVAIDLSAINALEEVRFSLAAWPIQPGYLDSYGIYIHSGIVNDIALDITPETIRTQHGLTGSEDVALGLHGMEFLLWSKSKKAEIIKRFEASDTVPLSLAKAGMKTTELPNNRRRQLLQLQGQLFTLDLENLLTQWQINGMLANDFNALKSNKKLVAIHDGLEMYFRQLRTLVELSAAAHEAGEKESEILSLNQFAGSREQALSIGPEALESSYFGSQKTSQKNPQKTSLAATLLSEEQIQQFLSHLDEVRQQLVASQGLSQTPSPILGSTLSQKKNAKVITSKPEVNSDIHPYYLALEAIDQILILLASN